MKKLTMSFWLAVAVASIFVVQTSNPFSHQTRADVPYPTCPPLCPDTPAAGSQAR